MADVEEARETLARLLAPQRGIARDSDSSGSGSGNFANDRERVSEAGRKAARHREEGSQK
jgi:general stress protein YciG